MAERINDAFIGQNAIGGNQLLENEIEPAHAVSSPAILVAAARRGTQRLIWAMACRMQIWGS
jgi:hypothetical protein